MQDWLGLLWDHDPTEILQSMILSELDRLDDLGLYDPMI